MIWEVCIQIRKALWSCNTSRKLIFKKLGVIVLKVNDQFLEPALSDCSVIRVIKRVWCCWKHEYKPVVESVEFAVTTAHVLRRMNVVCRQTERRETCVRVCSGQLVSMLCCVVWSVGQYVVLCGLVSWSVCCVVWSGQLVSMSCCAVWSVGQYVMLCGLVSWSVCHVVWSGQLVSMSCCVVWSAGQYVMLCGLVSWSVCRVV